MQPKPYIFSLAAGLIASMAWMLPYAGLLIIIAFILFIHLYMESIEKKTHHSEIFTVVLPGFLLFNIIVFSWLRKASLPGAILAIMINTFMMSFVFWLSSLVGRRTGRFTGLAVLVSTWLTYEQLTMIIPIFSPWLNPGNVFGNIPALVQWYEYTGTAGGTLWIFSSAIFILITLRKFRENKTFHGPYLYLALSIIMVPIVFSLIRYFTWTDKGQEAEIVIVQPNIDPFTEKFGSIPFYDQLKKMTEMAGEKVTSQTDWIIFPETAVDDPFYETMASGNIYVALLDTFLARQKFSSLLTGFTTIRSFPSKPAARGNAALKSDKGDDWYEIYNSAMFITQSDITGFYHKSKLVPGIEGKISGLPEAINKLVPELGGTMTGYGIQDYREVFTNPSTGTTIAPVICYESVFGRFVTDFTRQGADLICIITNDGWWRYTSGYRQHLTFASLRAIENRRWVARCANTGISCFIDSRGKIIQKTSWWEEATINGRVCINNSPTFYITHGDYIYSYAVIFTIIIIVLAFIASPLRRLREI